MPNPRLSTLELPVKDEITGEVSLIGFDLPASGSSLTIDDEIDSTSHNPVENMVISAALDTKANTDDLGTAASMDIPSIGNADVTQVVIGSDSRLTDARPASDVSAWAKAATKPSYTASEVGAIASTQKGANNGVAELDANGLVPSSQLPSYVDDVLEFDSVDDLPLTGETGKIYVVLDTNKTYRWSGSAYVVISPSLALGETSSTAYRGDRGKTAYNHSQTTSGNPHNVTKSDVGLGNVGNYKAVSTEASQGLTDTEKSNARTNIGAGTSSLTLGTSSSTAYRGDRGNSAYAHAVTNKGAAFESGLYKITTNAEGHVTAATAVAKADITALGIPASDTDTIPSAYCATAAATAAKTASCTGYALLSKSYIQVIIATANTAESKLTLNINGKGAKTIYIDGAVSSATNFTLPAGSYLVYYNGTNYYFRTDGKITGNVTGDAATVGGKTVGVNVPADAVFTDTNVTQGATTTASYRKILLSGNTYSGEGAAVVGTTGQVYEAQAIEVQPSTGTLKATAIDATSIEATTLNGVTIGSSPKFTDTNTKVTTVGNHYAPEADSSAALSADASSSTAATWGSTDLVTGVNLQRDAKGHVTGVTVDSIQMPVNPNTDTVPSAYCTTAAATAAKTATCTGYYLLSKSYIQVIVSTTNTAEEALTLNINGKGAKPIYINGSASSETNHTLPRGSYLVYYNGTNYYFRTDGKITGSITGDAATVNGKTVAVNVPSGAVFTDTRDFKIGTTAAGATADTLLFVYTT